MSIIDQNQLQEGLNFIFIQKEGSSLCAKQQEFFAQKPVTRAAVLYGDGIEAGLVNNTVIAGKTKQGDNLIVARKTGEAIEILEIKEAPGVSVDWVSGLSTFVQSYSETVPDSNNNRWKWGQKVPQDGEYLCYDCGYILDLKAGKTFPICEVCLSGEPDGPSGPEVGFWEAI